MEFLVYFLEQFSFKKRFRQGDFFSLILQKDRLCRYTEKTVIHRDSFKGQTLIIHFEKLGWKVGVSLVSFAQFL